MAAAAGADAIGVNLWPGSKRFVEPDAARDVLAAVPATVLKVGVFVDAPVDEVERRIDALGLDRAQLHGDESPAHFGGLDRRLIRVLRVRDEASFEGAAGGRRRSGCTTRTSRVTAAPAFPRPGR